MKRLWVASIGVALVAVVILARLTQFVVDNERVEMALEPDDRWQVEHSCLTAYAEAARFAAEDRNIYDRALYEGRFINGLKVDPYHYPPPFLLVPDVLSRAAGGYLALRPIWFAFSLALLVAMVLAVVRWVGGVAGRNVLLLSPLFFVAPTTLITLQIGNFQGAALALAMLGMIALTAQRTTTQALGGLALAYAALSKIFPGILGLYLLVTRRWRALAWTVGAGGALLVVAVIVYGTQPFDDFLNYQLPRMASGEAFPQSERPRVAASNMSFYGLLVKLRRFGVDTDISTGLAINAACGFVVIALALAIAWRRRQDAVESRVDTLTVWLALVNLASFRSPFVGGVYGIIGTTFLAIVLVATAETVRARIAWSLVLAVQLVGGLVVRATCDATVSDSVVAFSTCVHIVTIATNAWVCIRALRAPNRPILDA